MKDNPYEPSQVVSDGSNLYPEKPKSFLRFLLFLVVGTLLGFVAGMLLVRFVQPIQPWAPIVLTVAMLLFGTIGGKIGAKETIRGEQKRNQTDQEKK